MEFRLNEQRIHIQYPHEILTKLAIQREYKQEIDLAMEWVASKILLWMQQETDKK